MQRRAAFKTFLAALIAGAAVSEAKAEEARARRVVYHLDDVDKTAFALLNLKNHRAGGPQGIELSVVVLGPALALFHATDAAEALKQSLANRLAAGDVFYACINTLNAHGWTLADLVPGFALADKGGVVKLADLQAQGFVYLRP